MYVYIYVYIYLFIHTQCVCVATVSLRAASERATRICKQFSELYKERP